MASNLDSTLLEVLDVSDPSVLRRLMESVPSTNTFFTELTTVEDSDIEESDDEAPARHNQSALPIHRTTAVDDDDDDDDDDEEEEESNENGKWRIGTSAPDIPPFTGEKGLQVEMEDDATPLDYLRLMIDNEMMGSIVDQTNRWVFQPHLLY